MTSARTTDSATTAFVAAIFALIFWGGTAVANRYAVGFIDPITVATLRSMLAGAIALVTALVLQMPFPATRRDRFLLLLVGLFGFAIWPLAISLGLARTTASHAALILATMPIMTVLVASVVHRTIPPVPWWLGGGTALLATAILIIRRDGSLTVADPATAVIGDLIILAGCVLCAIGYVVAAKLTPKIGSVATTFWALSIALVITAPVFAFSQQQTDWAAVPAAAWWAIVWLTFLSSLLGSVLWFFALARGGIEKIGSLQMLMPIITLAGAVWILGELLTLQLIGLSALIIVGTFIAHRFSIRDQ